MNTIKYNAGKILLTLLSKKNFIEKLLLIKSFKINVVIKYPLITKNISTPT
jgi:hypothetical protein